MTKAIMILAVFSVIVWAGQIAVDLGAVPEKDADWLEYDDGTPYWVWWGGTYRGTWFNTDDFVPGVTSMYITESEIWFYHHENGPWDTSNVYIELWNGDAMGPVEELDQVMATAAHYAPVNTEYDPGVVAESNFWCLINTELSAGGWPSILTDNQLGSVDHTFASDDFIVWEPYNAGSGARYGFIRILAGPPPWALNNTTWGTLKTVF